MREVTKHWKYQLFVLVIFSGKPIWYAEYIVLLVEKNAIVCDFNVETSKEEDLKKNEMKMKKSTNAKKKKISFRGLR